MSGFLYFVPTGTASALEEIASRELSHALSDGFKKVECTAHFPADDAEGGESEGDQTQDQTLQPGVKGTILAPSSYTGRVGFYPDQQRWVHVAAWNAWLGYSISEKPQPKDLERPTLLNGVGHKLGDGQFWLCPVARRWTGIREHDLAIEFCIMLPQGLSVDLSRPDGSWKAGGIKARYTPLWDGAVRHFEELIGEGEPLTVDETCKIAVTALTANYRVATPEVQLLGLLDEETAGAILTSLVDYDAYLDLIKKKAVMIAERTSQTEATEQPSQSSPTDTPGATAQEPIDGSTMNDGSQPVE